MKHIVFIITTGLVGFSFLTSASAQYANAPLSYTENKSGYLNGSIDPVSAVRNSNNASVSMQQQNNNNNNDNTNDEGQNNKGLQENLNSNAYNGGNLDRNLKPGWDLLNNNEEKSTNNVSKESINQKQQELVDNKNYYQSPEDRAKEIEKIRLQLREGVNYKENKSQNTNQEKQEKQKESSNNINDKNNNQSYNIKGHAIILDGITLSIKGNMFTLRNIQAPGNGQLCYKNGNPWDCGNLARKNLQKIVGNKILTCSIVNKTGVCYTNDGGDIIKDVLQSGYALPTANDGNLHTSDVRFAKQFNNGLFQK